MKELTIFKKFLGDSPTTRLLEFLIEGRFFDYSLTELAKKSDVSWRTLHRIFPLLIKSGIVKKTREIGRAKLYTLDGENPKVKKLIELFDKRLEEDSLKITAKASINV
jgi:predicted transcriptional regulator